MFKVNKSTLKQILESVSFTSDSSYNYDGRVLSTELDTGKIPYYPLPTLIYQLYHCRKTFESLYSLDSAPDLDLIETLSEANFGDGTWDPDWKITEILNNEIVVEKNQLKLWTQKDFFTLGDDKKNNLSVGNEGYLFLQKEYRFLNPGFYMALGNQPLLFEDVYLKLYVNIFSSTSSVLMEKITQKLNNLEIPFQFKILSNPSSYPRSDAAVLYINKNEFLQYISEIATIFKPIREYLRPETSVFAKKLIPGIGLAEEIDDEQGFGFRMSNLFSSSLFSCFKLGLKSFDEQKSEFIKQFKDSNIDFSYTYLHSDSFSEYEKAARIFRK